MTKLNKFLFLIGSLGLAGCSSSPEVRTLTTKEIYANHTKSIDSNLVDESRTSWSVISDRSDERLKFNDDLRLPNPELRMTYFPKREKDGSIKQGYVAKFAMYERVHYKVGQ